MCEDLDAQAWLSRSVRANIERAFSFPSSEAPLFNGVKRTHSNRRDGPQGKTQQHKVSFRRGSMKLRRNERCPLHKSLFCCGPGSSPEGTHFAVRCPAR